MSDNTIAKQAPILSAEALREINSFDDAIRLLDETVGMVNIADVLGDGFTKIEKERLIDKEFVLLGYTFAKDTTGNNADNDESKTFVICRVVLRDGRKLFFTDGSTGVMAQCRALADANIVGGIYVARGLRVSEYEIVVDGKSQPASTFYFDTAKEA